MPPEQRDRYRSELLDGCVTHDFYERVYLPYAEGVQARTVENLQRVSRGKVTASVLLGAKQATAPLAYRVFADTVAVMTPEQLQHLAEQIFDGESANPERERGGIAPTPSLPFGVRQDTT